MIFVKINNKIFFVKKNISILEACKFVGILIPRFCYHESLSIAGNCRMCLVELEPNINFKPVSACTLSILEDSHVLTDTPFVKKARENVLETLLLNHPLDCPICDQGGECDLQDQTIMYGIKSSRYSFPKRSVEDKHLGFFIKTIMTRCIHCTRCVRFSDEICGTKFLGTLNRGQFTEIGTYTFGIFASNISGNVIDLCPVGALTSRLYAFKARPWELKTFETIDLTDSSCTPIFVSVKEAEIVRITSKSDSLVDNLFISDKARFSFDSNTNLRLLNAAIKKERWEDINWQSIISVLNTYKKIKHTLFLISDELDFQFIQKIYTLQFVNFNQVKTVSNSNFSNLYTNFFFSKSFNLEKKSKLCCVISADLQIENIFLNIKLRTKFLKFITNNYSSGFTSNASFPNFLLTFNFSILLTFFEGKNIFSFFFFQHLNPSFIFGSSSTNRIFLHNFSTYFLKRFPTSSFFFINKSCNTDAVTFFNISKINNNSIKKASMAFTFHLYNNIFTNFILLNLNKAVTFWISSHLPLYLKNISYLLPSFSFFEIEGIFINLDSQANKSYKIINNINNNLVNDNFFNTLFNGKNSSSSAFSFFLEMANCNIISKVTFTNDFFKNDRIFSFFQKYPFKPIFEDFYQTTLLTKNSWNMFKRSKEIRSISNNFF